MSTRSTIAYTTPDSIRAIYCHNDGYIDYVGDILAHHYTVAYKIGQLVELGDMSQLNTRIADCVYYGRDRKEDRTETGSYANVEDWASTYNGSEFFYLYDSVTGAWSVSTNGVDFTPLLDKFH